MNSCETLLNDYFNWASDQDLTNGKALVHCTIVSNESSTSPGQMGNVVSVATGVLEYSPAQALVDVITRPAQFSGELVQAYPRDRDDASRIRVTISEGGGPIVLPSPPSVSLSVIHQDEPSSQYDGRFEPQCLSGALYGTADLKASSQDGMTAPDLQGLYIINLGSRRHEAFASDTKSNM